jgi:hypothetical protein
MNTLLFKSARDMWGGLFFHLDPKPLLERLHYLIELCFATSRESSNFKMRGCAVKVPDASVGEDCIANGGIFFNSKNRA